MQRIIHVGHEPPPKVGYLIRRDDVLHGVRGLFYNYILAGNGLFIEANSSLITGRVQVARARVRGLPDLAPEIHLANGKIPVGMLEIALDLMQFNHTIEIYVAIVYANEGFRLITPNQTGSPGRVTYERADNVVLDLHSHGDMKVFFSGTDNKDEQGLRLYGVVGQHGALQIKIRLGIYGYYGPVKLQDVFDDVPPDLLDEAIEANKVLIPDYDPDNPAEKYPGGILPGDHELVKLLRDAAENPEAIRFIADMLEE